jgi:hypothetical protein
MFSFFQKSPALYFPTSFWFVVLHIRANCNILIDHDVFANFHGYNHTAACVMREVYAFIHIGAVNFATVVTLQQIGGFNLDPLHPLKSSRFLAVPQMLALP